MIRFSNHSQVLFHGVFNVQPDDFGTRHHQGRNLPLIEAEHVAHHGVFVLLDDAGL